MSLAVDTPVTLKKIFSEPSLAVIVWSLPTGQRETLEAGAADSLAVVPAKLAVARKVPGTITG